MRVFKWLKELVATYKWAKKSMLIYERNTEVWRNVAKRASTGAGN